jgi:hypothetical protein
MQIVFHFLEYSNIMNDEYRAGQHLNAQVLPNYADHIVASE